MDEKRLCCRRILPVSLIFGVEAGYMQNSKSSFKDIEVFVKKLVAELAVKQA